MSCAARAGIFALPSSIGSGAPSTKSQAPQVPPEVARYLILPNTKGQAQ